MQNVLWACAFVLVCIAFYRFALPRLRHFDEENMRRIAREESDKTDPNAHFRHALEVADEQVEPVTEIRVGDSLQFLFGAEIFVSREEAEQKRAERVGVIARRFYAELPVALASQGARGRMSARERAARRWGRRGDKTLH